MPNNHEEQEKPKPRRTEHAEQRAREGRRIAEALNDAQRARKSDVFYDLMEDRYIVRGARGREHVFELDGQQVTSLDRARRTHLARVRRGIIRRLTTEEFQAFKDLFK